MLREIRVLPILMLFVSNAHAQEKEKIFHDDSTHPKIKYLEDIVVVGKNSTRDIQQIPGIVGTSIYSGKKNALILVEKVQGNIVTNNMRQVMAKVPGIHVWESDGSGIQIGIAARGLSPNRSWEFNTRQNGYDISADPYGYPEAYYNPQLQAVQKIEVVRGHGSLQYGPQFGGMVNYILKNGSEINRPFSFETQQTIGSNGLFNSFQAIGGKQKNSSYYAFFDHRNANGWRQNSRYHTNAGFATYTHHFTSRFSISAEVMQSNIRSQQPGGLTDSLLTLDARLSSRGRNWFDIKWTTAAIISNYTTRKGLRLNIKLFGISGNRNSVGFLPPGGILIPDTINAGTKMFNPRNLSRDRYRNIGFEARFLSDYLLAGANHSISAGIRLYKGMTYRNTADGKGSSGIDYNMTVSGGQWTRDIDFESENAAVFLENVFRFFHSKLLIVPGIRYEIIRAKVSGRNGLNGNVPVMLTPEKRSRAFLLGGIGAEFQLTRHTQLYANITQAYRPVQFADLTSPPSTDSVDHNLKDARGYNLDAGYRGKIDDFLIFDISGYYMDYSGRIGTIVQQRANGSFYNYRTNVGKSHSSGFEGLVDINPFKAFNLRDRAGEVTLFASYAYINAVYGSFIQVTRNSSNQLIQTNLENKKVENAPQHIVRAGICYHFKKLLVTAQFSYVDETFADANNTVVPSANGQNGVIPSYGVADLTAALKLTANMEFKGGINNLADKTYFTRRSGGYPGPGALPADGRSYFLSVAMKF